VIAHFMQRHALGKDMHIAKAVQRVDWLETAGELGAYVQDAAREEARAALQPAAAARERMVHVVLESRGSGIAAAAR
jgi:hypothetical protein